MKNAQLAYDRAQKLLKTAAGTERSVEEAEAALRTAEARLNSAATRLTSAARLRARLLARSNRFIFRPGEVVSAGRPILSLLPPGNLKKPQEFRVGQPIEVAMADDSSTSLLSVLLRPFSATRPQKEATR